MTAWEIATSIIVVYLVLTLAIGLFANQKLTADLDDFFLYGRQAGFVVLYLTVVATYHSAFAFLGSSGFFYSHGIGFWEAGTWTVLVGAITYVLGTRIWALGKRFGYITPADMLADFYCSDAVRIVVALVSVVFTILYIQVQAQGLGYIISIATDGRVSYELGTLVLLTVAAAYLIAGGLRGVYWTDVIQGVWMYAAVWIGAMVIAYSAFDGPLDVFREVARHRPDLLELPGPRGFFTPGMWFGMTIVLSFGIIFQPHMLIRYYSAASAKTLRWLGATTPIYLMTLYIPATLVGLGGAVILPGLETPDHVFPLLLQQYAPAWLTGLILAGATAAAMSTLDSILHSNMTVLTRDVYQRFVAPNRAPEHYIAVGRVFVVGLLAVGYVLAVIKGGFLVILVTLSGAGALQLMPAFLGVLFPRNIRMTRTAVLVGIVTGLTTLYLTLVVSPHPFGVHGGVWALMANAVAAFSVSRFTRPPPADTIARTLDVLDELSATGEVAS